MPTNGRVVAAGLLVPSGERHVLTVQLALNDVPQPIHGMHKYRGPKTKHETFAMPLEFRAGDVVSVRSLNHMGTHSEAVPSVITLYIEIT